MTVTRACCAVRTITGLFSFFSQGVFTFIEPQRTQIRSPRHRSPAPIVQIGCFFLILALPAPDDDVVRPYYSNSVLWTLEMDYITTIMEDGKVHG